jgi:dTMP kinase
MARTRANGLLITLEGGEGSGKTRQASALAKHLQQRGHSVCTTREPGGTALGQAVLRLLRESEGGLALTPLSELLLFEADRAQHVNEVIRPALASGKIVVCDRFTDSSMAYQGYGRGLGLELIQRLNEEATGGVGPHLTLLLDIPPEVGLVREGAQIDVTGREPPAFHERVREGFLALAREEPERFVVIDATRPEGEVAGIALAAVEKQLGS